MAVGKAAMRSGCLGTNASTCPGSKAAAKSCRARRPDASRAALRCHDASSQRAPISRGFS
jgi:hypothetical protein